MLNIVNRRGFFGYLPWLPGVALLGKKETAAEPEFKDAKQGPTTVIHKVAGPCAECGAFHPTTVNHRLDPRWTITEYEGRITSDCETPFCGLAGNPGAPEFDARWLVIDRTTNGWRLFCDACCQEFSRAPVPLSMPHVPHQPIYRSATLALDGFPLSGLRLHLTYEAPEGLTVTFDGVSRNMRAERRPSLSLLPGHRVAILPWHHGNQVAITSAGGPFTVHRADLRWGE